MMVADSALRVKLVDGTLLKTNLGEAANYLTDHPKDSELVKRNINRMLNEYTAIQFSRPLAVPSSRRSRPACACWRWPWRRRRRWRPPRRSKSSRTSPWPRSSSSW